jgi:hypothetical protein
MRRVARRLIENTGTATIGRPRDAIHSVILSLREWHLPVTSAALAEKQRMNRTGARHVEALRVMDAVDPCRTSVTTIMAERSAGRLSTWATETIICVARLGNVRLVRSGTSLIQA